VNIVGAISPKGASPNYALNVNSLNFDLMELCTYNEIKIKNYFLATAKTSLNATIIVAGMNRVRIPRNRLASAGATASKMPTCIPKKETRAKTVPLLKKLYISSGPIFNDSFIYDNVVALFRIQQNNLFVVRIEDPTIAATMKTLFEMAWQSAKPFK